MFVVISDRSAGLAGLLADPRPRFGPTGDESLLEPWSWALNGRGDGAMEGSSGMVYPTISPRFIFWGRALVLVAVRGRYSR